MTIKIGRTHTVIPCAVLDPLSDRDAMICSAVLATEAVKRLVEATQAVCEAAHDDDRHSALVALSAALAAIEASGHRIVPVEPTEEMLDAAMRAVFSAIGAPADGFDAIAYCAMLTAYGQKGE